ncbi:hypothetical protein FKM82_030241 [Ascaphus truei]
MQTSTIFVQRWSFLCVKCPARHHFNFFPFVIVSQTFVCFRTHSFFFLSLWEIPSMHLFILLALSEASEVSSHLGSEGRIHW